MVREACTIQCHMSYLPFLILQLHKSIFPATLVHPDVAHVAILASDSYLIPINVPAEAAYVDSLRVSRAPDYCARNGQGRLDIEGSANGR